MAEKEQEKDSPLSAKAWIGEIELARNYFKEWREKGRRILDRYRDEEKGDHVRSARFNVSWASTEVMKPAIFSRIPRAECERRFKDENPVGRVAAMILERATDYSIDAHQDFASVAKAARDDFLLPGRGVLWERYKPYNKTEQQRVNLQVGTEPETYTLDDGAPYAGKPEAIQTDDQGAFVMEDVDTLVYEESITDYVYWEDFLHSPARQWDEVRWVARRAYMMRHEGVARFGDRFNDVPLDYCPKDIEEDRNKSPEEKEAYKKAAVWELWDKVSKKVFWISEAFPEMLDEQEDPLGLENFFPCARPLFATLTTDSLIPRPFFAMAAHQADEIDRLTERIAVLTEALRVSGVCAPDMPELLQVFKVDNTLVPIPNWAMFAGKGGFDGVLQFVPVEQVVKVLEQLYKAREIALQKYYEVTGWSDIIRGATDARETATAQSLKSQYAGKRIQEKQEDMQRFLRDQIAIKAEIIAEHFQPQTLKLMTGVEFLPPDSQQMFDEAVQVLRQDPVRCFQINIETDSTIALDEQEQKEAATEYLSTITEFISGAIPVVKETPALLPFISESLLFLSRRYKVGRSMEGILEQAMATLKSEAEQQAANPQPDPEMQKLQMQAQSEQVKGQIETTRAQLDTQKAQLEAEKSRIEAQIKMRELELKEAIAFKDSEMKQLDLELKNKQIELDAYVKEQNARIKATTDLLR